MPLRGIDFVPEPFDPCHRQALLRRALRINPSSPSLADSQGKLKLRPTKNEAGAVDFALEFVAASFSWAPLTWPLPS